MSFAGREVTRGWRFIKMPESLFAQRRFCFGDRRHVLLSFSTRRTPPSAFIISLRAALSGREAWTGVADVCLNCFSALCSCVRYLPSAFEWTRQWSHDGVYSSVSTATGERPQRGWLAQKERLAVSILLCWVYVQGGSGHSLARKSDVHCDLRPSLKCLSLPYLCLLCLGDCHLACTLCFHGVAHLQAPRWVRLPVCQHVGALFIVFDQILWIHWQLDANTSGPIPNPSWCFFIFVNECAIF